MHLCIDAADDRPGIALARDGEVVAEHVWETERNHSVELLPNIDRLITEAGASKHDLTAVVVDVGPGGYAALRVGVSIAKAVAHGLSLPVAGVGRLELDARLVPAAEGQRVVAMHRAGRGEYAWAAYRRDGAAWTELHAPAIAKPDALLAAIGPGDAVTGELDEDLADAVRSRGAGIALARQHRVFALAAAGAERLAAGRADDPRALVPLYLRAPAIGGKPAD